MAEIHELLGDDQMHHFGGLWRNRIREDARKVERIVAETRVAKREGRIKATPSHYANDLWTNGRLDPN